MRRFNLKQPFFKTKDLYQDPTVIYSIGSNIVKDYKYLLALMPHKHAEFSDSKLKAIAGSETESKNGLEIIFPLCTPTVKDRFIFIPYLHSFTFNSIVENMLSMIHTDDKVVDRFVTNIEALKFPGDSIERCPGFNQINFEDNALLHDLSISICAIDGGPYWLTERFGSTVSHIKLNAWKPFFIAPVYAKFPFLDFWSLRMNERASMQFAEIQVMVSGLNLQQAKRFVLDHYYMQSYYPDDGYNNQEGLLELRCSPRLIGVESSQRRLFLISNRAYYNGKELGDNKFYKSYRLGRWVR